MVRQDNCVRFEHGVVSWITGRHGLNFIFFLFSLSLFVGPQSTRTFHSTLNSERKTAKFPHVNAGSLLLLTFLFFMCLCCWVIACKINQIWKKVPVLFLYCTKEISCHEGLGGKHWLMFFVFFHGMTLLWLWLLLHFSGKIPASCVTTKVYTHTPKTTWCLIWCLGYYKI